MITSGKTVGLAEGIIDDTCSFISTLISVACPRLLGRLRPGHSRPAARPIPRRHRPRQMPRLPPRLQQCAITLGCRRSQRQNPRRH